MMIHAYTHKVGRSEMRKVICTTVDDSLVVMFKKVVYDMRKPLS